MMDARSEAGRDDECDGSDYTLDRLQVVECFYIVISRMRALGLFIVFLLSVSDHSIYSMDVC